MLSCNPFGPLLRAYCLLGTILSSGNTEIRKKSPYQAPAMSQVLGNTADKVPSVCPSLGWGSAPNGAHPCAQWALQWNQHYTPSAVLCAE